MKIVLYAASNGMWEYGKILSAAVRRQGSSPAADFSARVLADSLPSGVVSLQWLGDSGELLFEGVADTIRLEADGQGRQLVLEGRSVGSYLLDNEALPASYRNISLNEFGRRYFTSYGIFSYGFAAAGLRASYTVPKGKSEWEAIRGFVYACTGRYPYLNQEGKLELLPRRGREWLVSNTREQGLRFLSAQVEERRSGILSRILVRDRYGYYPTEVRNPLAEQWNIRRKRYHIPPTQYEDGREDPKTRIRRSMADCRTAQVTLCGLHRVEPGDRVQLELGGTRPPELKVTGVEQRFHGEFTTRLWLADAAYANL